MDTIQFDVVPDPGGTGIDTVRIQINGLDLIELVRDYEAPLASAEGRPSLAGRYSGLSVTGEVCPPSRHFLGQASWDLYLYGDRITVLVCECGEPGCWPLNCRITMDETVVRWSDFEHPHRSGLRGTTRWDYTDFGPFEFDREQYVRALETLRDR